jgi:hypothetical protein
MRRLLTWLGLGAGALAFLRWRRGRTYTPEDADPAEELKRKLAESRSDAPPSPPEPEPAPVPEEPQASLDERRRAVHDKARAAIDDMLGGERLPGEETE